MFSLFKALASVVFVEIWRCLALWLKTPCTKFLVGNVWFERNKEKVKCRSRFGADANFPSSAKSATIETMDHDLRSLTALKDSDYGGGPLRCCNIRHLTVKIRYQPVETLDSEAWGVECGSRGSNDKNIELAWDDLSIWSQATCQMTWHDPCWIEKLISGCTK